MENNIVTLGIYFEIKDSDVYGGEGTVGYANIDVDLKISSLESANISEYVECQTKKIAEMCQVDTENVRVISRVEYDEKAEE